MTEPSTWRTPSLEAGPVRQPVGNPRQPSMNFSQPLSFFPPARTTPDSPTRRRRRSVVHGPRMPSTRTSRSQGRREVQNSVMALRRMNSDASSIQPNDGLGSEGSSWYLNMGRPRPATTTRPEPDPPNIDPRANVASESHDRARDDLGTREPAVSTQSVGEREHRSLTAAERSPRIEFAARDSRTFEMPLPLLGRGVGLGLRRLANEDLYDQTGFLRGSQG
ncbi:MAG: hypothetical protein M1826_007325 [Phylliscum demangeonii]|nr:MAG: hypothetical protein M1826_007325 [Phylliscum demangeonii]